jgi:hypothetical protein
MTSGLILVYVMTVLFIIFTNLSSKSTHATNTIAKESTQTAAPTTKAALVSYKLP